MKPGRELDALVAEKVMGWRILNQPTIPLNPIAGIPPGGDPNKDPFTKIHNYSTEIAAAWEVVEKLRENHWYVRLDCHYGLWKLYLDKQNEGDEVPQSEASAPHAICLAALKAVGVEV